MEDGETVERKNRNLVRKEAAGGEMLPGGTSITHRDLHVLPGVVGKQQGTALAHRMRHWRTLKAADFRNSGAARASGTPHGHQHWEWLRKSLAGGKNGGCGLVSRHQSHKPPCRSPPLSSDL